MAKVNIKSEKSLLSEEFITQARLFAYVKNQEVCIPLYCRMRQMDKDGKKMVAEFVYRHAV